METGISAAFDRRRRQSGVTGEYMKQLERTEPWTN
jgi:hypothetical protein